MNYKYLKKGHGGGYPLPVWLPLSGPYTKNNGTRCTRALIHENDDSVIELDEMTFSKIDEFFYFYILYLYYFF
jgi:hypothetical protein